MIHAKNYATKTTFVKVMLRNTVAFFPAMRFNFLKLLDRTLWYLLSGGITW